MQKLNIGYVRVSSEFQKIEGHSIKYQENRIIDYFKAQNVEHYKIIKDEGYSAKDEKRPGYQKILRLIENKEIDRLIFLKIDRLSRNKYNYWSLCKKALKNEIELVSLNERLDFNSAIGEFSNELLLNLAVLERNQMSERVKYAYYAVLEEKNENGFSKFPFGGKMPLGISKDKNKFLYYNEEIHIVKEILSLHYEGISFVKITHIINEKYNISKGKNFIDSICKNTLYKGYKEYNNIKWNFLEPLELEGVNIDKEITNKRKHRNFEYQLQEYLPNYYVSTRVKKLKTMNIKREYVYYVNKNTNFRMSEAKLIQQIEKEITVRKGDIEKEKQERINKLNKLFTLTNMKEEEYNELKKEIDEKVTRIIKLSKVKNLRVDDNGFIILKLAKREVKFKYEK